MRNILLKILLTTFLLAPSVSIQAKHANTVVFLQGSSQNNTQWQSVIQHLSVINREDTQFALDTDSAETRKSSKASTTLYIGWSHRRLLMVKSTDQAAVDALQKIISGEISSKTEMQVTLAEVNDSIIDSGIDQLAIDQHGYLQLSTDMWATMHKPSGATRPTWFLLTHNPKALRKEWRTMLQRTIGATVVEVLKTQTDTPREAAELIASRLSTISTSDPERMSPFKEYWLKKLAHRNEDNRY